MRERFLTRRRRDAEVDRRSLEIRINRLVIEGVPAESRHAARIQAAMVEELSRLLQEGGRLPLAQGGAVPAIHAPMMRAPQAAAPVELGREIARSLHAVLTGGL